MLRLLATPKTRPTFPAKTCSVISRKDTRISSIARCDLGSHYTVKCDRERCQSLNRSGFNWRHLAYGSVQQGRSKAVTHHVNYSFIIIFMLTRWRDFRQNSWKPRSAPGRGALLPTAFFPSFRPASAKLTNRGGTEKLFYENENFTHNKFDEPVVPPWRDSRATSRRSGGCLLCAFAGSSSGLCSRLRPLQP